MPIAAPFSLQQLRAILVAAFPELAEGQFTLPAEGWDSVAVDVNNALISSFRAMPMLQWR